jgi:hypothetical protein
MSEMTRHIVASETRQSKSGKQPRPLIMSVLAGDEEISWLSEASSASSIFLRRFVIVLRLLLSLHFSPQFLVSTLSILLSFLSHILMILTTSAT